MTHDGGRWYRGWTIIGVNVFGQILAQGVAVNCFSLFLGDWSREFAVPISTLAFSISVFALSCCIASPLAGLAADKFPARHVFGFAYLVVVLMYVAIGMVTAAWQILIVYATLAAVATSFAGSAPSQALISRWFVRRRGLAMGLTASGVVLAGVLFPPIISLLIPRIGWRGVWFAFGAFTALLAAPMILAIMRDRPGPTDSTAYMGDPAAAAVEKPTLGYGAVLRSRNFWIIAVAFTLLNCDYLAVTLNLAPMVAKFGHSRQAAGLLLSLLSLAALVSKIGLGVLTDRFGARAAFWTLAALSAAGVGLVLAAQSDFAALTVGLMLTGLASGVWTPTAAAVAQEFGAANFGRVFGIMCVCAPVSAMTTAFFARLEEATGSYSLGLGCLIAGTAIAGAATFFLRETGRQLRPAA